MIAKRITERSTGSLYFDSYGDSKGQAYFNNHPAPQAKTLHVFDSQDCHIYSSGIMVEVTFPHWDGGPLVWYPQRKLFVDVSPSPTGFTKAIKITNAHTSYGGRIFVDGWKKRIYVSSYRVLWIPMPFTEKMRSNLEDSVWMEGEK